MQNAIAVLVVMILLVPGVWWVSHTRLVGARDDVEHSWADVGRELERRHALIPRLVDAVERATMHEADLLDELTARNDAAVRAPSTPDAANELEPPLTDAARRVLALGERSALLNDQQHFLELRAQLASADDRIDVARSFYNSRVEQLNRRVEAFPSSAVARRHGFERADFFDA